MSRLETLVVHDDGSTIAKTLGEFAQVINEQSRIIEGLQATVSLLSGAVDSRQMLADAHAMTILREGGLLPEKA